MPKLPYTTIALMALAGIMTTGSPARAQTDADRAPFRFRSLALSPTVKISNIGWDSNVFNLSDADNPVSDTTATASPAVDALLRTPRVRVIGHSQFDMYYFRELSSLRAIDNDHSGRVEVFLNRVMPWVSGRFITTRHRQNLEIDALANRRIDESRAGADVQLTRKSSVGVYAGRAHLDYQERSLFRGTDLARELNHTSAIEGAAFRYAATPLTTFVVNIEQGRDRFQSSLTRNSDSILITPSVEFKPLAIISGRAAIGFRKVKFLDANQPEFKGTVGSVDLQYTFRGRTQFAVVAQRNLEYSYIDADYVLTGFSTSVTQRFGEQWDAVGRAGRYNLSYRLRQPQGVALGLVPSIADETVHSAGASLGYKLGRSRIGLDVDHQGRESTGLFARAYNRLRVGTSVTYVF